MTSRKQLLLLILLTPIFLLLSHYLAVFLHEYSHAFTAWIVGYKQNPLNLDYGGTSVGNLLLLLHIDQNVNNKLILADGHPGLVALIAFAGPGMNIVLFFLSKHLLNQSYITKRVFLFYFIFFFALMNLGNIYDYLPIRTFAIHGSMIDIVDIERSLNISPWWFFAIGGYILAYFIYQFFAKTLTSAYVNLGLKSTTLQAVLMIICVLVLFGYFAIPGLFHTGISHFIACTSFIAIPGIVYLLWPNRAWVKARIKMD